MRIYLIYLIEDEFAEYFYGRESKIVELFKAERRSNGDLLEIIRKQINYITRPLPYLDLHKHLSHSVEKREFFIKGKSYCKEYANKKDGAELTIEERFIHLKAWGGYDSESSFFEVLRKFDGRFLAMDMKHNHYGWVKPIKERKYV
ncbi:sporulation inhibitor of replication protein SirA [Lederbergia sp. NSJ-179]|uniref:sporulation inhibitor of replication protein SirA n=1 Tax=Lederbergia sp. NSJ-179 TaxID=2931402 RepID=UPI001FCFD3CE|nr:sporulation inhibitor of replication protein SirA [Lederbergia sp. NSJ-179]MCJ7841239.1 sporulation inhibitor of replication protein SirA [Lederbergia sp. NSJ-179]